MREVDIVAVQCTSSLSNSEEVLLLIENSIDFMANTTIRQQRVQVTKKSRESTLKSGTNQNVHIPFGGEPLLTILCKKDRPELQ